MNKNSVLSFPKNSLNVKYSCKTNIIRKRAIIGKTKELKIFNFLTKVYHINEKINSLKREKNKRILAKGNTIAKMLFIAMFTRERSFNQLLEKIHKRKKYKNMFSKKEYIPKAHVFRDGIKEINLEEVKEINKSIIKKAKENKVYREGTVDGLVAVGVDGVESFGSYKKDWNGSYKAKKKVKEYRNGIKTEVEKEYHKQINVFAKIVGKRPGLLLDYETVTCNGKEGKQEYEPDVAIKLIERLKKSYGQGIDVIVGDAIYLEEKFLKTVISEGYIAVVRLKDNRKAFIAEAEGLFKLQTPEIINKSKKKQIKCWSEVLEYKGIPVKAVKFEEKDLKNKEEKTDIIYVVSTSINLSNETINKIIHKRWDIENDGFNELKNYWNMKHCFMADEKAINIILQMMLMCYNLWELYLYGHLHHFEDIKITKLGYIEMVVEIMSLAKAEELLFSSA